MKDNNKFWGFFLIIIGVLLCISKLFHIQLFNMGRLWPMFVLIPGLCFQLAFFSTRRAPGVLVPGGILTTIGLLFFFETMTNWHFAAYTWPIYPLAVAIGLFELYLFGDGKKEALIPALILTFVSACSFGGMLFGDIFRFINHNLVVPVVLIIIGIAIIFKKSDKNIHQ